MRTFRALLGTAAVVLALSGCASSPAPAPALAAPALPPSVGNGVGSQYGNYGARMAGEMTGPAGEHCVVFNWDRPLTRDLAVRYVSASCDSKEHPGMMECRELSHAVIPIAQSNLQDMQDAPGP